MGVPTRFTCLALTLLVPWHPVKMVSWCTRLKTQMLCDTSVCSATVVCVSLTCRRLPLCCCYCCFHSALNAGKPAQVTVTCKRNTTGWPEFGVSLMAFPVDNGACAGTVTTAITGAIIGPDTVSICAQAPNTTLTYRITSPAGGMLAVGVATNTSQVACSLRNQTGKLTGGSRNSSH
jgi:hypothetical protein